MSAFTDRLYRQWVASTGGHGGRGPHGSEAKRREGYPNDQGQAPQTQRRRCAVGQSPAMEAPSRNGAPRAKDAASRPEKPDVLTSGNAIFLPSSEKSSVKSIT